MKTSIVVLTMLIQLGSYAEDGPGLALTNLQPFPNTNGAAGTLVLGINPGDPVDTTGAFFRNFGSNKRTCFTCHAPSSGWTVTPQSAQDLFQSSSGLDPLFRTNDGSNAPELDVSTLEAKRKAYSMLLSRGVIRVGLPIPANAEFTLAAVDDPYHHASASDLSLFRRPLPSQNLAFLSDVMWDGRETALPTDITTDLGNQANDATKTHAATTVDLQQADEDEMVQFEQTLFFAQLTSSTAGSLTDGGALGGPEELSKQNFYLGMNDPLGRDPKGTAFDPTVFATFRAWQNVSTGNQAEARSSVARGEELFNHRSFSISGVAGLNDVAGKATIQGTCTTCHNTPNVGGNSSTMRMNIGVSDESQRTADLPLYTLKNIQTGAILKTTDPGRALISGKWADIGSFKIPSLRGLSGRAPYFHNGSAKTIEEVISYLNQRFQMGLSVAETSDLAGFLKAL